MRSAGSAAKAAGLRPCRLVPRAASWLARRPATAWAPSPATCGLLNQPIWVELMAAICAPVRPPIWVAVSALT